MLLGPRIIPSIHPIPKGPLLIIANHVTMLDGSMVLYALPARLRRHITVAMSGEVLLDLRLGRRQGGTLRNLLAPAGYWLITALFNVFPLPRLQGFRRSFARAGQALDQGESVLIFPEGSRSHSEQMAAFRPGIGLLAAQSRVPVLPIALIGLATLRPGIRNWLRTGRLEIRIGDPITLPEGSTPTDWTTKLEIEMRKLHT